MGEIVVCGVVMNEGREGLLYRGGGMGVIGGNGVVWIDDVERVCDRWIVIRGSWVPMGE